jgi:hypothetical protein
MDLQVSFTFGMLATISARNFTCNAPANLDDEELLPNATVAPQGHKVDVWTDSLPQVVLAMSLPERLEICELLSNIRDGLDYEQVRSWSMRNHWKGVCKTFLLL